MISLICEIKFRVHYFLDNSKLAKRLMIPTTVEIEASIEVYAKYYSGNFTNIPGYISQTQEKGFSILSGNDQLILWTLKADGVGLTPKVSK